VVERKRKHGRVYALRFHAYGQRRYLTLPDGTTREQAHVELENVLADVRRGIWRLPEPEPEVELKEEPTFHQFASEWWEEKRRELRPKTRVDYEWRLTSHLLPYFARYRLSQITVQEVDRYRQAKVREREAIRRAAAEGNPVTESYIDRRGKESTRKVRALSNGSINKTLVLLAQILEVAVEYELIDRNAATGKRRRLTTSAPRRSYLDTAEQIGALLSAANELDAEALPEHRHIPRRAMLATLVFGGLRLGELLALRWRSVDLAAGRLRIGESKTDAGLRDLRLLPILRDVLADLKAGSDIQPGALVFATAEGRWFGESNLRSRVLAKAIERANKRLDLPLPAGLTPHSLRRTFASLLYALGASPPEVMAEMGHTDPKLALSIYAQAMRRDEGERDRLRALVRVLIGHQWAPGTGSRKQSRWPLTRLP
jgi:integrase